ncbi:type II toxin-antitoxin system HicA family toxin [Candidatus Gottesmanbacteria bacterium]|nr:type II toxin-antitoxin system HicA family toxin [Candidatus Gottesmanbacteria bacterium]
MPKLPVLKAKDLLKKLKQLGFYEHHQSGSHIQMHHPDGRRTTIPYHPSKEIRRGTIKAIIDDLNMTVEEFTNAK